MLPVRNAGFHDSPSLMGRLAGRAGSSSQRKPQARKEGADSWKWSPFILGNKGEGRGTWWQFPAATLVLIDCMAPPSNSKTTGLVAFKISLQMQSSQNAFFISCSLKKGYYSSTLSCPCYFLSIIHTFFAMVQKAFSPNIAIYHFLPFPFIHVP